MRIGPTSSPTALITPIPLLAALLLCAGCASAGSAPGRDVLLEGSYEFSAEIRGEAVHGMLRFHDDGGYEVISSHGSCTIPHHQGRPVRHARGRVFTTRCGSLSLEIPVREGALEERGVATVSVPEEYTTRGRCIDFDPESRVCRQYDTEVHTRDRSFSAPVVVRPG
jgi:hypothetical protein